jgi:branched-chain amino acid aminotransferase
MVCPVGPYYKGGFGPDQGRSFIVSQYDRAAPRGTGHIKAGGNYASSFLPGSEAKAAGYTDAIFLDPTEHKYIDEIGAANFLAFRDGALITPDSHSALRSITRRSLLEIASEIFGWETEERRIALDELDHVEAAACCGTAAILTWIQKIVDGERGWTFTFDERWQQLHDKLVGIQTATDEDPFGWRHEIPVSAHVHH